ncbi:MAG: CooT family nickel-binding protein [Lachnospiraceae bacterium]|nr:CooT family nickel-binding protein [Lachnospiraceae bacterium]MCQ2508916.1 CooT family nickel-binding protein [Lachnospiraceae bacterium]MDO4491301.1 CooT family nickel-binding protein [Lachnospiraceae bacterium]
MCLATVYKSSDDTVIMRNVSKIEVDGEFVLIQDLFGDVTKIQGKILMVDLGNSVVKLSCE